jgi:hypothetical protein
VLRWTVNPGPARVDLPAPTGRAAVPAGSRSR